MTSLQLGWDPGLVITSNPVTLRYRVYLDNGSGNDPVIAWDSSGSALANIATLKGLITGHSYKVKVAAVNELGEGAHSTELTIYAG